jgi:hypothetical protein
MTRILAHKKNTGDLQGENPQKYNIRSCNREKKGNRPETIRNNEKNRRKRSKNNAPGDRAPRGNEKPADEQRRATDRTNRRLGFQPSPILREKASERKKRSRYSCGALVRFSPDVVFDRLVLRSDHPACSRSISAGCDEAFQLAQRLLSQLHGTEALRLLELGSRAQDHAQRYLRCPVLILERGARREGALLPTLRREPI